ncbi:MAG: Integral rane protein TerC [Myxococcaceae bacterium]|nr:Integral rane protein TerC [Myxococcaceae bacterium]
MIGTPALWLGFIGGVILLLLIDLFVVHRHPHKVSMKEAGAWSVFWVALSLVFAGCVGHFFGRTKAIEFLGGYAVEKALSIDNLFVFLVLLTTFKVPKEQRHGLLFWGVLGALVLRGIFIAVGSAMIERFHITLYIMGVLLVIIGARMIIPDKEEAAVEKAAEPPKGKKLAKWFKRFIPTTDGYREGKFFVHENGKYLATPLFIALLAIEVTDVIFAVDSVPAVFGVTRDPFIVFTSNALAILGLRSLFFVLASMIEKFRFLRVGLAIILTFVGTKMVLAHWWHTPMEQSVAFIGIVLLLCVVGSVVYNRFSWRPTTTT